MNSSRSLKEALRAYVERIGQISPPLGDAKGPPHVPDEEDSRYLQSLLAEAAKRTDILIWLAAGLLTVLFLFCLGLILIGVNRGSEPISLVGGGGSVFSLLIFVGWLRQLWFDKSTMTFLTFSATHLSPTESARLVTKLYFEARTNPMPIDGSKAAKG
jgi:hypothetical protein